MFTDTLWTILIVIIALLGPALGSFFSVIVMREEGLTKVKAPKSECDHCGTRLKWYQLIPIVSFVVQRGKCTHCHKNIDARMWLAEVLGLAYYVLLALAVRNMLLWDYGNITIALTTVAYFAALTMLFYLSVFDLFTYTIPVRFTKIATFIVVGINALFLIIKMTSANSSFQLIGLGGLDNLILGVIFAAFIYLIIVLTKQRGMGEGDVYIALLMGLMLGWPETVTAFYVMVISATLAGLVMTAVTKKFKGLKVPLVPFMTLGFAAALVWGNLIFNLLFFGL